MSHTFELIWHLVKRDFQLRYAGSKLGFLWSLAIPLSQLLMLVFVFGKVIPLNIPNYPVFVFIALLPWNWFSSSLMGASSAFLSARALLRYPNFQPAVIIGVNTAAHLLTFALTLPVLFGMMYWYGIDFPWMFLSAFPLLLLIQGALITGLSFIVATANVFYRDISQFMSLAISLLFFLTPIWYGPETKGEYGFLFQVNPVSLIVQNYRRVLLDGQWLDWPSVTTAALTSIGFVLVGYLIFRHLQSEIVDTI
jgi:ABC-type polysaccharide/polyol phosphate export permease